MINVDFFRGKSVLVTGHTGFKGAWLWEILKKLDANITGYSLEAKPGSLFEIIQKEGIKTGNRGTGIKKNKTRSIIGDIRHYNKLLSAFKEAKPDIVIHMAAQPLVLDSYEQPVYTFETNVIGTVNVLECIRQTPTVRSVIVVTTDKVYQNLEQSRGYQEEDKLGGHDPYSASKACTELVAASYNLSFLRPIGIPMSTARAGNVIGGGDISDNRIIPDCVQAAVNRKNIMVRNPMAVRPYQHVLEPLFAYLLIIQRQWDDHSLAGSYNIGPAEGDCITTGTLADIFCNLWGNGMAWEEVVMSSSSNQPHEAGLLHLDCTKIRECLDWHPVWNVEKAISKVVEWEKTILVKDPEGDHLHESPTLDDAFMNITRSQIEYYLEDISL